MDVARARRHAPGPGRAAAERLVARRMGRLRGLPQKVGQILSLGELDGGGSRYAALTESAPQAPARDSFTWITRELGRPLRDAFLSIDPRAAAASLGQVHRAVLPDGRTVAVKVQYPDVAGAVDADLAAIGLLAAPVTARREGFDADGYRAELRRVLTAELDYRGEAEALRRFAARRHEVPGLVTPEPIDGYCTDRVLTMTWVDGDTVAEARTWPLADRRAAMRTLVRCFLRGCFVWHEVHADPHAGNLRFSRTAEGVQVGLLDFGCTRRLTPAEAHGLFQLAAHGAILDETALAGAWSALGFPAAVTAGLRHRLREVTRILVEPFSTDGPFDAATWLVADRLAAALGDDRWTFRFAGPPALLFLIRAFQGLVVYARALDAAVDWRAELHAVPAPAAAASSATPLPEESSTMASDALKVEVVRDGQRVVAITFPAGAVAHLADLVPSDLHEKVRHRGISLEALARDAVARGCPPGDLVALDDAGTRVRVWLE
jgi:predicted unusual protein kinase regulating ubiquinone biosynthesis (AarF/ABC1/UbiB family)